MSTKDFQDKLEALVYSSMSDTRTPHAGGATILEAPHSKFKSSSSNLRPVFASEGEKDQEENGDKSLSEVSMKIVEEDNI